jgi:hypothetical protein
MTEQQTFAIAMLIKPLVLILLLAFLLVIRLCFIRWFPDGKIKRLLLTKVKKSWR